MAPTERVILLSSPFFFHIWLCSLGHPSTSQVSLICPLSWFSWLSFLIQFFVCLQHPLMQSERIFFRNIKAGAGVSEDWGLSPSEIFFKLMAAVTESACAFHPVIHLSRCSYLSHVCTFHFLHISNNVGNFLPYLSVIIYVKSFACKKKCLSHYQAGLLRAYCAAKSPSVLFFSAHVKWCIYFRDRS